MAQQFDVVVIGAGTAGITARRAAEAAGARAVLIGSEPLGTTCARVGCMPSKLLIAAADAAHHARTAGPFGLRTSVAVDRAAVMQRVQRERDRFVGFVLEPLEGLEAEGKFIRSFARFVAEDTVALDSGETVQGRAFVIATGTAPYVPEPFRAAGDRLLTSDSIFELKRLPESLLVVGAGPIGLELGQAMHRLGVRTTVLCRSERIGGLHDPEVGACARKLFTEELDLHLGYTLHAVSPISEGAVVEFAAADGTKHKAVYEYILAATGRRADLNRLEPAKAGIDVDERGIPQHDPRTFQIGTRPYFVAGDITGERPILHEAAAEGKIAGENAARFPDMRPQPEMAALGVVFSDPQIAVVGRGWEGDDPRRRIGSVDYADQGRARVMRANKGFVRIYGDADSRKLTGAEMLGPSVEHTAHLLAWAIQSGLTVDQALAMPFYHPVVEEGIRTALRDLAKDLGR